MTSVRLALAPGLTPEAPAVRAALQELCPQATGVAHHCPRCASSAHGRPVILGAPDRHLSVAHADGHTILAVADGPVGVDLERPGSMPPAAMVAHLAAGEVAADPTRAWVRKEAVLKAEGVGLQRDPRTLDAGAEGEHSAYEIVDVDLPGWICAVAGYGPMSV